MALTKTLIPDEKNIFNKALIDTKRIVRLSLQIKIGLLKHCLKALRKDGEYFKYFSEKYFHLSEIFVQCDNRKIVFDFIFEARITITEKVAWTNILTFVLKAYVT